MSIHCAVQTPEGQPVSSSMSLPAAPSVQSTQSTPVAPGAPAVPGQAGHAADGQMQTVQVAEPAKKSPKGGCGGDNPMFSFILLGVMFVVFYLFMIRPQQKRQKETQGMLNALTKGDRVVTTGGMLGTIVAITDQVVTLEVQDKVRIKVLRSFIQGKQPGTLGESRESDRKKNNDKESKESDS